MIQGDAKIKNIDELEFAVFCIENIAIKLGKHAEQVYSALTEKAVFLTTISYLNMKYCIHKAKNILWMISSV